MRTSCPILSFGKSGSGTKNRIFMFPGGMIDSTGRLRRHHLAFAEIDLLDGPCDRRKALAPRQPRLRVLTRASATRSAETAESRVACVPAPVLLSEAARS